MKKLSLALSLLLAMACTRDKSDQKSDEVSSTNKVAKAPPSTRFTMNGMPFDEANEMVRMFLSSRKSSHPTTSIWFDKKFIDAILQAEKTDSIDGVRFYFAKDKLENTVIPVATKEGEISQRHQVLTHTDFFELSQPISFLAGKKEYKDRGKYDLYTSQPCNTPNCPRTPSTVSCNEAVLWAKKFQTAYQYKEDINTTSIWYSIEFFLRLAEKIRLSTADGKDVDGIRLYFIRNDKNKNGLVFIITLRDGNNHSDDATCYHLNKSFYKRSLDDRGEECPIFCSGTTWNDCEP